MQDYTRFVSLVPTIYGTSRKADAVFSEVGDIFHRLDWIAASEGSIERVIGKEWDEFIELYTRTYNFSHVMIKDYTKRRSPRVEGMSYQEASLDREAAPYREDEDYAEVLHTAKYCLSRLQEKLVCAERALVIAKAAKARREALMREASETYRESIARVEELARQLQLSPEDWHVSVK